MALSIRSNVAEKNNYITEAIIILFLMALTIALLYFIPPRFYGADDIQFEELMGGYVTGKPESHVYFIMFPLSWALSGLYSVFPGFPWYATFLISIHLVTLLILLHVAYSISKHKIITILSWMAFLAIDLTHMVNLEWTTTAGTAAVAVMLLVATQFNTGSYTTTERIKQATAVLMLLLSFNLRYQSMLLALPVLIIVYITRCVKIRQDNRGDFELHHLVKLPAISIVLCLVCVGIHFFAYSDADWKAYSEYTTERSNLVDYVAMPDYNNSQELYDNAGISSSRYALIRDQNYLFGFEKYDIENLHVITEQMAQRRGIGLRAALGETISALYSKEYLAAEFCILALVAWIMLREKSFIANLACIGLVLYLLSAWIGLTMMGRMIYRVESCLLIAVVGGLAAILIANLSMNVDIANKPTNGLLKNAAGVIKATALTMFTSLIFLYSSIQVYEQGIQTYPLCVDAMKISEYETSHPDRIILRDLWSFVADYQPAFDAHESKNGSNAQWMGGWFYGIPNQQSAFTNLGIENPSEDLLLRDDVVVAVSDMRTNPDDACERLATYLSDYFGHEVSYRLVDSLQTSVGSVRYYSFYFSE